MMPIPLIVGLGNRLCGDDAAGPVIAAELARGLGHWARVADHAGPLWDLAAGDDRTGLAIIIDAAEAGPGFPVGRWRRIRYPREAELLTQTRLRDTHTLSVEALLRLGEALGRRQPRFHIYAVAGRRFQMGDAPSPGVIRAVPGLVRRIETEVRQWLGMEPYPASEIDHGHYDLMETHSG